MNDDVCTQEGSVQKRQGCERIQAEIVIIRVAEQNAPRSFVLFEKLRQKHHVLGSDGLRCSCHVSWSQVEGAKFSSPEELQHEVVGIVRTAIFGGDDLRGDAR